MVVPLGWMLDDRREPVPRLFRSPAEVVEAAPARRRSRQRTGDDTLQLRLDTIAGELARIEAEDPELPPAPVATPEGPVPVEANVNVEGNVNVNVNVEGNVNVEVDVEVEGEPVSPWLPVFDQNDDLSGLLKARGRLLSRAFNGAATDGP
jgi:hypothetical protein